MTASVQSTVRVSFDAEDGGASPVSTVKISYLPEHDFVKLEQGADVIVLPFEDAADFVAILRGWVDWLAYYDGDEESGEFGSEKMDLGGRK